MILTLQHPFSAAHLYHQPKWSDEKNLAEFGKCFTEYGHGHNYTFEVGFKVEESSLEYKKTELKSLMKDLCDVVDHQHLNFVIPEFKTAIPTTENIALYFLDKLKQSFAAKDIAYIKLFEMENLWTEIRL